MQSSFWLYLIGSLVLALALALIGVLAGVAFRARRLERSISPILIKYRDFQVELSALKHSRGERSRRLNKGSLGTEPESEK